MVKKEGMSTDWNILVSCLLVTAVLVEPVVVESFCGWQGMIILWFKPQTGVSANILDIYPFMQFVIIHRTAK